MISFLTIFTTKQTDQGRLKKRSSCTSDTTQSSKSSGNIPQMKYEVYQGCLKALREWIRDGPLTGVAEYEKKTLPKRNLDDVPEHERRSCCDGPPLERAIRHIVEEVRAHESDNDLMKMYNEAKKASNVNFKKKPTLNDLVKSLERFLTRSFKTIQAAACRIFQ